MSSTTKHKMRALLIEDEFDIVDYADAGECKGELNIGVIETQMAAELGDEWDVVGARVPGGYNLDSIVAPKEVVIGVATTKDGKTHISSVAPTTVEPAIAMAKEPSSTLKVAADGLLPIIKDVGKTGYKQHLRRLTQIYVPRADPDIPFHLRFLDGQDLTRDEIRALHYGVLQRARERVQASDASRCAHYQRVAQDWARTFSTHGHVVGKMYDVYHAQDVRSCLETALFESFP